jgi:hypothetical protein
MEEHEDQVQVVLNLVRKQQEVIDKLTKIVSEVNDKLKALEKVVLKEH